MKRNTKIYKSLPAILVLTATFLLLQFRSLAQVNISGPNCVVPGVAYNYSISAYYSGTANFTYNVSGGTLSTGGTSGTHSGPGLASVTITWSGSGTITLSSPGGGTYYPVSTTTAFTPGSITSGGSQTINYGTTPATINCSAPSGGTCTTPNFVYQWQQSPDNVNFYNVNGATGQNLSFSAAATQTMYYRRSSTETTGNNTGYTNVASVVLNPPSPILPVNAGSVTPSPQYINYNTTPTSLSSTGVSQGNYAYSYQWQSSPDNSTWTNIPCNIPFYSPGNLTSTTFYRVAVTSNSVTNYSTPATINVYPQLFGGSISPAFININAGTSPGGLYCTTAIGGTGTYTYQWQSSTDGVNFSNVGGATSLTYVPGNLSAGTWYRVMVTSNGVTAYSSVAQVSIVSAAPDVSFVRTRTILKAGVLDSAAAGALTSPYDVTQTTQYVDGLGRPVQTVAMQQSPLQHDLVSLVQYDDFGRESYKDLPYVASTSDGNYKATGLADMYGFNAAQFPGELYYFGQVNYEPSPLNRELSVLSPGLNWEGAGRGVSTQYQVNTIADSVRIWTIGNTSGSIPTSTSTFAAGTLHKTVTSDEAGHSIVEYKDIEGKIILKKTQLATSPGTAHVGWLCIYYIYDMMSNLRFVIQPQAVQLINGSWNITTSIANELCFRYEYDLRKRIVIKKIPGAGEQWTVYDTKNRVVMTQDSVLRGQHKWLFTRYDTLNRPDSSGLLTDPTNYNNLAYHQNLAVNSTNYPVVASYTNELLTQTFYDDYNWAAAAGLPGTMATGITSNSNNFVTSYNASPVYAANPIPLYITRGQPTGTMKKVLGTSNQYLYAVSFYDDRGRSIQSQAINYTGATDTVTTQYDFSGKVIRNVLGHKKSGNTAQNHIVVSKMDYDHAGRLRHLYKNIDNAAGDQLIDSIQYNELGQLRTKYLGNGVDSLIYDYNVRGWMTEINKSYLTGAASHYFGMELAYDNTTAAINTTSYANPAFNGNIAGVIWKSAGDGVGRKYDFSYDNVNRLVGADFNQATGSGFDKSAGIDFSVSNLSYDANGNILSMQQKGFKVGGSATIDSLVYAYLNSGMSNRLMGVADGANDPNSKLGDFHYPGSKTPGVPTLDYTYDGNGNLTQDNNKAITSITYNYLNLPQLIQMNGKGTIQYWYDAAGNKLQKQVVDATATPQKTTTTLYIGGMVYQNDTMQFIGHEEGRARWAFHKYVNGTTAYKWEYDFFEKDHLGNTRVVLSQQKDTAQYVATMEAAYRNTENQLFYNLSGYPRAAVSGYPADYTYTNPNDSVARVNGNGPKVGPGIVLKVMSGDKVDISTQFYYNGTGTNSGNLTSNDLLNSLASGLVSLTGGAHGSYSDLTGGSSPLPGALTSFISANNTAQTGKPQAFLNWILLDDQFKYVSSYPQSGAIPVGSAGTTGGGTLQAPLAYTGIPITKSGYLYIYVSNATPGWDVFFDNLSVKTYSGPMLEETHYYPFGLTMAGISDKALKSQYATNKYRYNGKELQNQEFSDGSGLEWYDYKNRFYDDELGRFFCIDKLSEKFPYYSPFQFAGNKFMNAIDLDGLEPVMVRDKQQIIQSSANNNGQEVSIVQEGDKLYSTMNYINHEEHMYYWKSNNGKGDLYSPETSRDENGDWTGTWQHYLTAEQKDILAAEESSRILAESFYHLATAPFLGAVRGGLLVKLLINSAVEFTFNGKDADVGDIASGEIPYAGMFLQSAIDWKPFSSNKDKLTSIFTGNKSRGEFVIDIFSKGSIKLLHYAGEKGGIHKITVNGKPATKEQIEQLYSIFETFMTNQLEDVYKKKNKETPVQ